MKYIEINNPYYNFNNKCFYIDVDLIDEENEDIKTKSMVLTKRIWWFLLPKELQDEYEERRDLIQEEIKESLRQYSNKIKDDYKNNWDKQTNIRKINKNEIKINLSNIENK